MITFKDGKLGVNFAGFTADVGLGGLLTGNAAHGGLSASAGTPFGQKAGAGIGGTVNGPNGKLCWWYITQLHCYHIWDLSYYILIKNREPYFVTHLLMIDIYVCSYKWLFSSSTAT